MVKAHPLNFLPNLLTLSSLVCGCLGIVWTLELDVQFGVYMIWICAILDVLDGLVARALKISSELGIQLDSLADLIAFGLLPATLIYVLSAQYLDDPWPYLAFMVTASTAWRLGRFNLDPHQKLNFKGLPAPANAILISSFPTLVNQNIETFRHELENPLVWLLMVGILSYLLVSKIPLLGFKFQNLSWRDNKFRYLFLGVAGILGAFLGVSAIPWILIVYIVISLIWQYHNR